MFPLLSSYHRRDFELLINGIYLHFHCMETAYWPTSAMNRRKDQRSWRTEEAVLHRKYIPSFKTVVPNWCSKSGLIYFWDMSCDDFHQICGLQYRALWVSFYSPWLCPTVQSYLRRHCWLKKTLLFSYTINYVFFFFRFSDSVFMKQQKRQYDRGNVREWSSTGGPRANSGLIRTTALCQELKLTLKIRFNTK